MISLKFEGLYIQEVMRCRLKFVLAKEQGKNYQLMVSKRAKLQEDMRFRILHLLEQNPEMSQRQLAEAVGISAGSVHYVLNALIEKGFVKLGNFTAAEDKRRYAYVLTPKGIAEKADITKRFLARKMEEYAALKSEIEELRREVEQGEKSATGVGA